MANDFNLDLEMAAAGHIVRVCGSVRADERVLIVCDPTTEPVARMMEAAVRDVGAYPDFRRIPPLGRHGQEPGPEIGAAMLEADLAIGLTRHSMAHTQARLAAARKGTRYLSMPDYSLELLADPSIMVDYVAHYPLVRRFADAFTRGSRMRVQTRAGTDIVMDISGRIANACPGYVSAPGELGSPPDIEANISPIEEASNGVVVVDGSIPGPEVGLLRSPVTMTVRDGAIVDMEGPADIVSILRSMFAAISSPKAYILAECGVGMNDLAQLRGVMLTDEGTAGTMHFGFGSNITVGGLNDVPFHHDFVFYAPTLSVDEEYLLIDGKVADS